MSRYQPANNGGGYDQGGYRDTPDQGYGDQGYGNRGDAYPMSSQNPYAAAGPQGYNASGKKKRSKWLLIGLPLLIAAIIVGAVVGGVVGSRKSKDNSSDPNSDSANAGNTNNAADASGTGTPNTAGAGVGSTATGANGNAYLAVNTDSYLLPVYATGTATSGYSAPTVLASPKAAWPSDPSPPSNGSIRAHPRLGAPAYKWEALNSGLIANDPYLKEWNETIIGNASKTLNDDPLPYTTDGGLTGSGVLDIAREMKLRVKNWAYAYKITNDTAYANRVFLELKTAAGNNTDVPQWGANDNTRWNPAHFLDVAEFTSMFAIAYDWLYDFWTDEQRDAIMFTLVDLGLSHGLAALKNDPSASSYSWWTGVPNNPQVDGNWNCVINGGMTMGALAIMDRDQSNTASQLLELTVPNAQGNCFAAAQADGSWAETANYWYFGTTGAAEMVSSLISAYGDDRGLSTSNPGWHDVSLFHMYVQGMTSLFNYGDHGPNKFSSTANSLLLWADVFNEPRYALYQRDHYDASEPWSMFWYDPAMSGTWWDGLALDKHFDSPNDDWATARSSWSENSGTYWAIKAGSLTGHQTHGDLDAGDFVLDAMGQRWAGELGSGQYLATGYFDNEKQDSPRWLWYRKRTEGQNTILVGGANQKVTADPSTKFESTGTQQGPAPSFNVSNDDTAYFSTDMTSAYDSVGSLKRAIRFLNGRRQILIQDDFSAVTADLQWRMHTNATVNIDSAGTTAVLTLGGQTLDAVLKSGPSGAKFETLQPVRLSSDPALPSGDLNQDQENPGVTVLAITVTGGGSGTIEVLFNPKWPGLADSDFVNPATVAIDSWSLSSHN